MSESTNAVNSAAASFPRPLVIGGKTFVVTPPGVEDFFACRDEARRLVISESSDAIDVVNERISKAERAGKPLSPTMVKGMIADAMAAATSKEKALEPTEAQMLAKITAMEMFRWWAWWLVRKVDASVTRDQISEWVPEDKVGELTIAISELMEAGQNKGPK